MKTPEEWVHDGPSVKVDVTHIGRCVVVCDDSLALVAAVRDEVVEELAKYLDSTALGGAFVRKWWTVQQAELEGTDDENPTD